MAADPTWGPLRPPPPPRRDRGEPFARWMSRAVDDLTDRFTDLELSGMAGRFDPYRDYPWSRR